MEILYKQIGVSIASARKKKGISQEGLGTKLQLTRTSITNIEQGRQHVQVHTLYAISDVLGVSLVDLLPARRSLADAAVQQTVSLTTDEWLQKLDLNIPPTKVQSEEIRRSKPSRRAS